MNIQYVTISGADDTTNIRWMQAISHRFPFVEWGILASNKRGDRVSRYPSLNWLMELYKQQQRDPINLSFHICGEWVREICRGNWTPIFSNNYRIPNGFQRVQLNIGAHTDLISGRFVSEASQRAAENKWSLIFQVGDNMDAFNDVRKSGLDIVPLFDMSRGRGKTPKQWPTQPEGIECGYAGGLGPVNIMFELDRIREVANGPIWIDMESGVRTNDGKKLDAAAVEKVLNSIELNLGNVISRLGEKVAPITNETEEE